MKNVLNDPFGLTLIIPAPLPLPRAKTLAPGLSETQVPDSKAPAVNARKPVLSPEVRSRSARWNCRSGLQAR